MQHFYFLIGGTYGDASLLKGGHVLLGVFMASDIFRDASQGYCCSS